MRTRPCDPSQLRAGGRGGLVRGRVISKNRGSCASTSKASHNRTAAPPVGAEAMTGPLKPYGGSLRTTITGV